ncbi:outer membrane beta-barrel protein [Maribellus mangrovi]|uniref:outer membrane beta-barrel protein n=1 Tax=Maribellus mangrovi TaxID=3133146 RepID=UPI0030EDF912
MKNKSLILLALILNGVYGYSSAADTKTEQEPQRIMVVQKSFEPHLRINGYTFYAFDDKVDSYYSSSDYFNGKIKGGFQWGGGLEYMLAPVQSIEISYLRLDTEAPMNYYNNGAQYSVFDVATNYILVGGNRYFPTGAAIEPYAGAQLGLAIFNVENPDNGNSGNATKFAWGLKAGLNIWASEMIGLKIQTGLNSAVQAAGGSFWFGGGGSGAGISTYSTFFQFYIGGGLTIKVGN